MAGESLSERHIADGQRRLAQRAMHAGEISSFISSQTFFNLKYIKKLEIYELGAPGDEYMSPCREGRPRLFKDKTHRPATPSGIQE